ncbi:tetratricopeptide repeat protein [Shewanella woodyi]|uniref:tetratricopeptide repeat protein n=1 Tax=Shewanella woodyi TaxID=60961 RepID=UPI001E32802C|nr:tetratricopeptide repeat protein [Shewanella woodyi]
MKLPWLSYRLLCVLCESAPGIVSQQELIERIWPEIVVGDETLKQRIKLLRRVLDDNAADPTYIEAIRGRGYRLIPHVEITAIPDPSLSVKLNLATDTHVAPANGSSYPLYWKVTSLTLAFVVIILACIALLYSSSRTIPQPVSQTLAAKIASGFDNELYENGLDYYHRYREEDNKLAIELFNSAIEINPNMARAYAGLSDAYSQGIFQFNGPSDWQQLAIDAAYKAIALDPNLAQGYKSLGLAYYNRGWLTKAISANLKAVQKRKNYNEAMSNLGFIYREMGQLKQALHWIDKALEADPSNSVSMLHKAQILFALAQYPQANIWLEKALQLQPDSLLANNTQGQSLLQQGLFLQAKAHYQELIARYPKQLVFIEGLANALLYLGEEEQARELAKQLIQSDNRQVKVRGELLSYLANEQGTQAQLAHLEQRFKQELALGSDRPSDSMSLARLYAKSQANDKSYRYLIQAINQGWLARNLVIMDPSFKAIKEEVSFNQLIDEMDNQRTRQQ